MRYIAHHYIRNESRFRSGKNDIIKYPFDIEKSYHRTDDNNKHRTDDMATQIVNMIGERHLTQRVLVSFTQEII
jgi:hypothetical protein